jgi:hypothetical protein
VLVIIEDARMRRVFHGGAERYQGAGSVKCDSRRWQEFCEAHKIPYALLEPSGSGNKIAADPDLFERVTGFTVRVGKRIVVSEHGRCAAMMVYRLG